LIFSSLQLKHINTASPTLVVLLCKKNCESKGLTYFEIVKIVKGENSDLFVNGHKVHVQTEDWGPDKRVLVSRVFKNGSVHKTFKLDYEKIDNFELETQRKKAVSSLHQTVIDWTRKEI
jgi:hypothetical protein